MPARNFVAATVSQAGALAATVLHRRQQQRRDAHRAEYSPTARALLFRSPPGPGSGWPAAPGDRGIPVPAASAAESHEAAA